VNFRELAQKVSISEVPHGLTQVLRGHISLPNRLIICYRLTSRETYCGSPSTIWDRTLDIPQVRSDGLHTLENLLKKISKSNCDLVTFYATIIASLQGRLGKPGS
jgi:hypothetical protein